MGRYGADLTFLRPFFTFRVGVKGGTGMAPIGGVPAGQVAGRFASMDLGDPSSNQAAPGFQGGALGSWDAGAGAGGDPMAMAAGQMPATGAANSAYPQQQMGAPSGFHWVSDGYGQMTQGMDMGGDLSAGGQFSLFGGAPQAQFQMAMGGMMGGLPGIFDQQGMDQQGMVGDGGGWGMAQLGGSVMQSQGQIGGNTWDMPKVEGAPGDPTVFKKNLTAVLVTAGWNRVTICHMEGSYLYVHEDVQSGDLATMEMSMAHVYAQSAAKVPDDFKFTKGTLFAAPYGEEGVEGVTWTRVEVQKALGDGKVEVCHMDYGSTDVVKAASLRTLSAEYVALPAQAIKCRLNLPYILDPKNPVQEPKCAWLAQQLNGQQLFCTLVDTEPSTGVSVVDLFDGKLNSLMPWLASAIEQVAAGQQQRQQPQQGGAGGGAALANQPAAAGEQRAAELAAETAAAGVPSTTAQDASAPAIRAAIQSSTDNPELAAMIQNAIRDVQGVPLPMPVPQTTAAPPLEATPAAAKPAPHAVAPAAKLAPTKPSGPVWGKPNAKVMGK